MLCEGPKSARDCKQISKLLVEKRLTNANNDAPPGVHQLSVATCQPAAGRESTLGPLGHHPLARRGLSLNSLNGFSRKPVGLLSGLLTPHRPYPGAIYLSIFSFDELGVSRAPRRVRLAREGVWARLGGGGRASSVSSAIAVLTVLKDTTGVGVGDNIAREAPAAAPMGLCVQPDASAAQTSAHAQRKTTITPKALFGA